MKKEFFSILLIILFTSIKLLSQEFIVKNFKEVPTDISAREYEVLDVNDEPCAIIKIYTGLSSIKIEGNRGVEKMTAKESSLWVWVPQGTRQLKISKDGMVMLPYYFPDELKSSTVYSFDLTTDQLVTATISTPGVEAELELNGKVYKTNQPIPDLAENFYRIKIFKLGYTTITDTIDVTIKSNFFSYNLSRTEQAKMAINTVPSGCVLFVNGNNVGTTDHTGFYFPGEYKINISKINYQTIDTVITFDPKVKSTFNFNIEKNTAFLKINVQESGAYILVDGVVINSQIFLELNAGVNHEIEVRKEKYRVYKEAFSIKRNDTIVKNIQLELQKGELSFILEPNDAIVEIEHKEGAKYTWIGSENTDLPVGNYTAKIIRRGFIPIETNFEIRDNEKTYVTYKLMLKNISGVKAGLFSTVLPGSGQLYSQRKKVGIAFMSATFAMAAASGYLYYNAENLGDAYIDAKKAYEDENDITIIEDKRTTMDNAYNDYIAGINQRNMAIGITAGVYIWNIIDAVVFANKFEKPITDNLGENLDINLIADPISKSTGLSLTYKF